MNGYAVKQSSTAYPLIFLMIDSSDHITGKTGLSPTVTISKNGAAFGSPAGAVTEIGSGWYKVAGNATDTGTLGPLALHATSAGADMADWLYMVVSYDPQSATNLGLSNLDGTVTSRLAPTVAGRTLDVTTTGEAGIDWANIGAPTTSVNLSGTTIGILTTYTGNTPQTGDSFARIGATGSGLTSLAPSSTALSTAQWTNTRAGLLDNLDAAISTRLATAGYTAPPSAATIAGATWDVTLSGHLGAGTTGAALNGAGSAGDPWGTALPGAYGAGTAGKILGSALTVGTVNDKTGYKLASDGLDSVSTAAPTGVAANFREMMVQVWRRFFKKSDKAASGNTLKTYADNGTTVLTTQTWSDDGANNESLGAAS